jgi:hypothetical protein
MLEEQRPQINVGIFWFVPGRLKTGVRNKRLIYTFAGTDFVHKNEDTLEIGRLSSDVIENEIASVLDYRFSHFDMWDEVSEGKFPDADFATYPRGRVMFSLKKNKFLIYIDKSTTGLDVFDLIEAFEIYDTGLQYQLCYDEHYTCDIKL